MSESAPVPCLAAATFFICLGMLGLRSLIPFLFDCVETYILRIRK